MRAVRPDLEKGLKAMLTGFPFNFALGALEAGHQPEIFLAGEAGYVMKEDVAAAILPVGMPTLREMLDKVVEHRVPIYV